MVFGRIRCALGRHRVHRGKISKMYGREVSSCKNCGQVLEHMQPGVWEVAPLQNAKIDRRYE